MPVPTIEWVGDVDGHIRLIEQTLLPERFDFIECTTPEEIWDAIKQLAVRGAPAIGCAGALGMILGIQNSTATNWDDFSAELAKTADYLASSRPTAVNLFWAIDRMKRVAEENKDLPIPDLQQRLLEEAIGVVEEDKKMCRAIGSHGAELVTDGTRILTHCNAGGLATADYGTALAVMFSAHEQGKKIAVYADETRPLLQGSRLTAWELMQAGIDVTLICDNMAGQVMKEGKIDMVVVGSDRIAANGDAANKIGTYSVSILAKEHGIPFYVAAPSSTFDLSIPDGTHIPIEERASEEITEGFGKRTAPEGVKTYSPAFDVTPHENIAAIITEKGVIERPDTQRIAALLGDGTP